MKGENNYVSCLQIFLINLFYLRNGIKYFYIYFISSLKQKMININRL